MPQILVWLKSIHRAKHALPITNSSVQILILGKSMRLIDRVMHTSSTFMKEESGAPLIEYVLIGSLVAAVLGLFLLALNKDT